MTSGDILQVENGTRLSVCPTAGQPPSTRGPCHTSHRPLPFLNLHAVGGCGLPHGRELMLPLCPLHPVPLNLSPTRACGPGSTRAQ